MDTKPEIFISHSHQDQIIVEELIDLLSSCIEINSSKIVCSSVPGHRLPNGEQISSSIKNILNDCTVIIGLISQNSIRSNYVNFELGVGWYLSKAVALIDPQVGYTNIPGPLKEHNGLMINSQDDIVSLVEYICLKANLKHERISVLNAKINNFVKKISNIKSSQVEKRIMELSVIGKSEDILHEACKKVESAKSIIRLTSFGITKKKVQPSFFIESFNSVLINSIENSTPIEVRVAHSVNSNVKKKNSSYSKKIRGLFKYKSVDINAVMLDFLIIDNSFAQISFPRLSVDDHFRTSININDSEFINELIEWYDNYLWNNKITNE